MAQVRTDEFANQVGLLMRQQEFEAASNLVLEHVARPDFDVEFVVAFVRSLITQQRELFALPILETAIEGTHESNLFKILKIEIYIAHRDAETAIKLCDELLADDPTDSDARGCRAIALRSVGRVEDAKQELFEIISADPLNINAQFHFSIMHKYKHDDEAFQHLEIARQNGGNLTAQDRAMLQAAIGKAHEDIGEFDTAFRAYEAFNADAKSTGVYFEQTWANLLTTMPQTYNKAFFESTSETGRDDAKPIFIFGLPRSGTTLVEQILGRSTETNPVGETEVVTQLYNNWLSKWTKPFTGGEVTFTHEALLDAAAQYEEKSSPYKTSSGHRIVDKTLTNYLYLGFLHLVYPNATFIHCVRNPLDIALSCYFTHFGPGMGWTYDLGEIGRYFRRYQKLMKHWRDQLPHSIHTVYYEELISDPEGQSRRLIEACGLDWDSSVLNAEQNDRPIYTASVVQARQPIYKTSMGRAARFEKHLKPLKAALGKAADPDWFKS